MSKDLPGGGVGRGLQVEIGNGWGVDRELRWAERVPQGLTSQIRG